MKYGGSHGFFAAYGEWLAAYGEPLAAYGEWLAACREWLAAYGEPLAACREPLAACREWLGACPERRGASNEWLRYSPISISFEQEGWYPTAWVTDRSDRRAGWPANPWFALFGNLRSPLYG